MATSSPIKMDTRTMVSPFAPAIGAWSISKGKRVFDLVLASIGFLLSIPLMGIIAILVKCSSAGSLLFRQERAGRFGTPFELLKFRTMANASGPLLTRKGDPRVTRIGRMLRRTKLDELPQLLNVIRGDMSLVGPRPDLPQYWETLKPVCPRIFELQPGLTSTASLCFRDEESLLATVPADSLSEYYTSRLLPTKAKMDLQYAETATLLSDIKVLFATVLGSNY